MMIGRHHHRGLSAASGVGWFFLFTFLTVAVLSYKGVGVISYPPEAADIPVIGGWFNVPAPAPDPEAATQGRRMSEQEILQQQVRELTAKLENHQRLKSSLEADLEQRNQDIVKLQADLARLKDQQNLQKDAQKAAVAKIYERMNSSDAVKILEGMEPERAAIIIGAMKQEMAAEILGGLDPSRARLISDILAGFTPPLSSADVRPPVNPATPPTPANTTVNVDPLGGLGNQDDNEEESDGASTPAGAN